MPVSVQNQPTATLASTQHLYRYTCTDIEAHTGSHILFQPTGRRLILLESQFIITPACTAPQRTFCVRSRRCLGPLQTSSTSRLGCRNTPPARWDPATKTAIHCCKTQQRNSQNRLLLLSSRPDCVQLASTREPSGRQVGSPSGWPSPRERTCAIKACSPKVGACSLQARRRPPFVLTGIIDLSTVQETAAVPPSQDVQLVLVGNHLVSSTPVYHRR